MKHPTYSIHRSRSDSASDRGAVKGTPFFSQTAEHGFFRPATQVQRKCAGCQAGEELQRLPVQAKLTVGQPGDKYEQEADAVADKVMRMPGPKIQPQSIEEEEGTVRMQSLEEEGVMTKLQSPVVQLKCAECEREEEERLRRKPMAQNITPLVQRRKIGGGEVSQQVASSLRANKGSGQPLPDNTRSWMENRFNTDFSQIKVHTDSHAVQLSNDLNAQAFTHGSDIYFNKGKYAPGTSDGKHLLAHELTHTIQQTGAGKPKSIQRTIGDGHDFPAASRFSGNVVLEAVFDNQRAVAIGRNGNGTHVRLIQQALLALNYPLPVFGADGSFGNETRRAVRAFQADVGLGVDGVVGFRTIDFLDRRDRNAEVAPPVRPVTANTPFNVANAIVQPGAAPSNPIAGCTYGLTFPENVQVGIDVFDNGGTWQPVLSQVTGNYSLQFRILPTQTEVTGPGGNTTAANYCAQITELNNLGHCTGVTPLPANWYMLSAVLAHERIHASRFRNALIHPSVIAPLETAMEGITIPRSAIVRNATIAEVLIRLNPAFAAALTTAQANWLARILVLVTGDHAAGGPTDTAEHGIVDPMVRRICTHARANGWPACPPLCP